MSPDRVKQPALTSEIDTFLKMQGRQVVDEQDPSGIIEPNLANMDLQEESKNIIGTTGEQLEETLFGNL